MFKKSAPKQTQAHLLKSSDRKRLLKQLQEQYKNIPSGGDQDEELENASENNPWKQLVPIKHQNVQNCKLVVYLTSSNDLVEEVELGKNVPNRKKKQQQIQKQQQRASQDVQTFNVITVDDIPMFFTIEKEEIYFPTIFALQIAPNLVDTIYISQPVSHYMLQGADLMKPGVSKNQVNQNISLPGGDKLNLKGTHGGFGLFKKGDIRSIQVRGNPIPFAVGEMTMDYNEFTSTDKGKCFEVVHIFNDYLWQFGMNHAPASYVPPAGFGSSIIEKIVTEEETEPQIVSEPSASTEGSSKKTEEKEESDDEETPGSEPSSSSNITPEEMDSLLEKVFIVTLKSSVEDDQLPQEGSAFYTKMFEFTEDVEVDIKKSTYKKWSKFLKQMQKENIIKAKDVKGTLFVTNINRSHPKYVAAKEAKRKAGSASGGSSKSIQIIILKKPTSPLLPIFGGPEAKDRLFTEKEVREAVIKYSQDSKIFQNGKVKINELIYQKIFKNGKVQNVKLDAVVPVQSVIDNLLNEMIEHYAIIYDGNENEVNIYKGTCPSVTIEAETIMGNKVITKVDGVSLVINNTDLNCVAFEDLVKKLRNKCSASLKTNTEAQPVGGGVRESDITIQGNHIAMIQQVLTQDYGLPAKYIATNDKTKKKKKK